MSEKYISTAKLKAHYSWLGKDATLSPKDLDDIVDAQPAEEVEPIVRDYDNETEYIGRDALLYMIKSIQDETRTEREEYLLNRVVKAVEFLPKARVEPVVRGEWKHETATEYSEMLEEEISIELLVCSVCDTPVGYPTNYCPECGAHMERSGSGE